MMTSETSSGFTPDCSSAALMAVAPSVGDGTPVNWPSMEPMAVRLAPAMTIFEAMGKILRWLRRFSAAAVVHYRAAACAAEVRSGEAFIQLRFDLAFDHRFHRAEQETQLRVFVVLGFR